MSGHAQAGQLGWYHGTRRPGSGTAFLFLEGSRATSGKTRFTPVGSSFDLPELEHGVLELWKGERSFEALRKKNAGGPRYSFIDGPITANIEAMGVHHAWGRTY
jgi:hypothetical protein